MWFICENINANGQENILLIKLFISKLLFWLSAILI